MRHFLKPLICLYLLVLAMAAFSQKGLHNEVLSVQEIDKIQRSASHSVPHISQQQLPANCIPARQPVSLSARPVASALPARLAQEAAPLCQDTSLRLTYSEDSDWLSNDWITPTRDGNILIPGYKYHNYPPYATYPHLLKVTKGGDTIWHRVIKAGFSERFTDLYNAFELNDGSILLTGNMDIPTVYNGRSDFLMVKLSADGNLLWQKTFSNTLWNKDTTSGSTDIYDCKQDAQGNIILCGDARWFGYSRVCLLLKMTPDGEMIWSRNYTIPELSAFTSLDISGDSMRIFGFGGPLGDLGMFCMGAKVSTGDTLSMKSWSNREPDNYWRKFYADDVVKLNNGNFVLYGRGFSNTYNYDLTKMSTHYGMAEFTPDFNFVRSSIFRSWAESASNNVMSVFSDGSAIYERSLYVSAYTSNVVIGNYQQGQLVKERVIPFLGISDVWVSNFLQSDDGGHIVTHFYGDSNINRSGTELMHLHMSDTSGSCLGSDSLLTIIEPSLLTPSQVYIEEITDNVLYERQHPFNGVVSDGFDIGSNCKQISYCDSLKLIPSLTTLCPGTPVSLAIRKNKACGAFPTFSYDTTSVQSFLRVNDTTVSINFRSKFEGYISAAISGCKPLADSVKFTVLEAPGTLSLGPDTVICPGNTILLNARKGYASYLWQDGSKDSVYTITKPGKYYITTTDACGGSFSDTVTAASHPPIPFDIGADLSLCAGASATVTAPPGFISYGWSPAVGLNTSAGQTVIASPLQNIQYIVMAEQTPGCFAVDSFKVSVKGAPPIHLGNDTTLCSGQSLLLSAGSGFGSYTWSTGETTPSIEAQTQGSVWVRGEKEGCISADTLVIRAVYPLPVFSLGEDTTLCEGQQLPYSFTFPSASYLWNSGATTASQTISSPGSYHLAVMQNGCSYADTVTVFYQSAPVFSLGNDTTLCKGESVRLASGIPGASLHWQDGSTASSYLVTQSGRYILTASLGACSTADSISVSFLNTPDFSLGNDTTICTSQKLLLAPKLNVPVTYLWSNGSTSPTYTAAADNLYFLTATGVCGSYTDSIKVAYINCVLALPSAFTPGRDGINDVFRVKYPFPALSFHLVVFNRWGQKVWQSSDMSRGWDGTVNGYPASPDAYIWQLRYTSVEGKENHSAGTVVLFR